MEGSISMASFIRVSVSSFVQGKNNLDPELANCLTRNVNTGRRVQKMGADHDFCFNIIKVWLQQLNLLVKITS